MPADRAIVPAPEMRRIALPGTGEPIELALVDWPGPADRPPLLCIPGFTRTGRDFEELARALAGRRRVICIDPVGRGGSSRLADPAGYVMANYLEQLRQLLRALEVSEFAVVGISMGGLLAMALAADPSLRARHLVAVDVGPGVPKTAVELLDLYLGFDHSFGDFDALLVHVKRYFAACNLTTELAWRLFALRGARKLAEGGYGLDFDRAIRVPFRQDIGGMAQAWEVYDRISASTLVLRGAKSHVLTAAVAEDMTRRGPRASLVTIADTGHWPPLMTPAEIDLVVRFLDDQPR